MMHQGRRSWPPRGSRRARDRVRQPSARPADGPTERHGGPSRHAPGAGRRSVAEPPDLRIGPASAPPVLAIGLGSARKGPCRPSESAPETVGPPVPIAVRSAARHAGLRRWLHVGVGADSGGSRRPWDRPDSVAWGRSRTAAGRRNHGGQSRRWRLAAAAACPGRGTALPWFGSLGGLRRRPVGRWWYRRRALAGLARGKPRGQRPRDEAGPSRPRTGHPEPR